MKRKVNDFNRYTPCFHATFITIYFSNLLEFHRCRFMRQYKEDDSPCGFYVGANPGKSLSPEEYNYREEDEMIDVYSMGNIFYVILTGE